MPPLPLTKLLQTALPKLSNASNAVVSTLGCCNGQVSSDSAAQWIGLRSRYQLARLLRRDGLLPFEDLAGWTRVLHWLRQAEFTGASLHELARRDAVDPATAYRLVQRVTRMRWSELRQSGVTATALRLRHRTLSRRVSVAAGQRHPPPQALASTARGGRFTSQAAGPVRYSVRNAASHPRGALSARLPMSGAPFDVAITVDGLVWVTRTQAASVDRIELHPPRRTGTVRTGAVPTRIAVSPSGRRAYVTNQFAEEVGVLDLRDGRQVAAIPIPGHPLSAVLAPDGRILYVTTNLDYLHAIWLATGQIMVSVAIPMACTSLVLGNSGNRVYVPTWRAGWILELDAHTLRTTREFAVGGVVHELALLPEAPTLYATNEEGWLDALHLPTGQRMSLHFEAMPHGLAPSPDGELVYVGLLDAGAIAVVDRRSLALVGSVRTGGKPRRIAFGPTGQVAVVANETGWVDVIH
jgi:DNA-binding beta-propeller fold protein YncE